MKNNNFVLKKMDVSSAVHLRSAQLFSCWPRLLLSADNPCKQFLPRSGSTERYLRSGSKPFDSLIAFLQENVLKRLILKKKQQTITNQ